MYFLFWFYTIQDNNLLIADKEESLTRFYDNVLPLPEDYEEGKYIIGSMEKEIEVPDYETVLEEYQEPVYKSVEQLDEEGYIIGYIEELDYYETKTREKLVQVGTYIETVIVPCLVLNPNYEAEQLAKEQERIAMLKLTRGDVFRGLLQAKGITRTMLRATIEAMSEETQEQALVKEMALIDFDEALDFYRGNALIDTVGLQLGITKEQLDAFFETNDYTKLIDS